MNRITLLSLLTLGAFSLDSALRQKKQSNFKPLVPLPKMKKAHLYLQMIKIRKNIMLLTRALKKKWVTKRARK
jgi:hypothetical protein